MSNKKVFKNLYSEKINKDKNYQEIIKRIKKQEQYQNILKKTIIPITATLTMCLLVLLNLHNDDKTSNINDSLINYESSDVSLTQKNEMNDYSSSQDKDIKVNDLDGVTMTIKDGTLTKTGATIIIKDISSKENVYGEEYRIDKYENGIWKELAVIEKGNYAWTSIGYFVGEDNKLEFDINWEWLYGELTKGKYRLVKNTSTGKGITHYITAEFIIEQ